MAFITRLFSDTSEITQLRQTLRIYQVFIKAMRLDSCLSPEEEAIMKDINNCQDLSSMHDLKDRLTNGIRRILQEHGYTEQATRTLWNDLKQIKAQRMDKYFSNELTYFITDIQRHLPENTQPNPKANRPIQPR